MAKNRKRKAAPPKFVYQAPHKAHVPDSTLWTPKEVLAVLLALVTQVENLTDSLRSTPFNSEARADMADIVRNMKSAKMKLEKQTMNGQEVTLPDVEDEELPDYLEKGAEIPKEESKPPPAQGSSHEKLQHLMGSIQSLIEAADVGATVILHCPKHAGDKLDAGETLLYLTPSYSILRWIYDEKGEPVGVRIVAKAEEYGGDTVRRDADIRATASMIGMLLDITEQHYSALRQVSQKMHDNLKITHTTLEHLEKPPKKPPDD